MRPVSSMAEMCLVLGPRLILSLRCHLPQALSGVSNSGPLPSRLLPAQLEHEIPCQHMPGIFLHAIPTPMMTRTWLGPGIRGCRSAVGSSSSAWRAESWDWSGDRTPHLFPVLVHDLGKSLLC